MDAKEAENSAEENSSEEGLNDCGCNRDGTAGIYGNRALSP